jgi:hypothetical protein
MVDGDVDDTNETVEGPDNKVHVPVPSGGLLATSNAPVTLQTD